MSVGNDKAKSVITHEVSQCDQTARLFIEKLAIYINDNLPKSIKITNVR